MTSMFDPPARAKLAPKPEQAKPVVRLPADVTLRSHNHYCDWCGADKDGNPITLAAYKVGVRKGYLYFCRHHFNLPATQLVILANKYLVTELDHG